MKCRVLEVQLEHLLRFSWQGGSLTTEVKFILEPLAEGTRLSSSTTALPGSPVIISNFLRGGWGRMTRQKLPAVLDRLGAGLATSPDNPALPHLSFSHSSAR